MLKLVIWFFILWISLGFPQNVNAQHVNLQNVSEHSSLEAQIALYPRFEPAHRHLTWKKEAQLLLKARPEHIQAIFKRLEDEFDLAFNTLHFDANKQQYQARLTAAGILDFTLLMDWPESDQLRIGVQDSWIPAGWILTVLCMEAQELLEVLQEFGLRTHVQRDSSQGEKLIFAFKPDRDDLKLSGHLNQRGAFSLHLTPEKTPERIAPTNIYRKRVVLNVQGTLSKASAKISESVFAIDIKHRAFANLGPEEVRRIEVEGRELHERVENINGQITGTANFLGNLKQGQWTGTFAAHFPDIRFKSYDYKGLKSYPFDWRWRWPYRQYSDFEVRPRLPELASDVKRLKTLPFHEGRLQYTIDGPDFTAALMAAAAQATQSIKHEVYVFHSDRSTQKLARLYTLKAMGLKEQKGQLVPDPYAPEGVTVQLMHNHTLARRHAENITNLFKAQAKKIRHQLQEHSQDTFLYERRAKRNFQLRALDRGIVKTDHRKLILIDQSVAFVGGINLGNNYLTERAFHDVMCQISGPVVQELETAFENNWRALAAANPLAPLLGASSGPLMQTIAPPKPFDFEALPRSHAQSDFYPRMALLLHDHDTGTLLPAMLSMIRRAEHTLRIEQAYFYHPQIMDALKAAKARGVNIEIVVSYFNDEAIFERLNLNNILELKQAEGTGEIRGWLYLGKDRRYPLNPGDPTYMVHTKYISMDQKEAIVGSTNMIPRSLQSPFFGLLPSVYEHAPALFNEEVGIWIKDQKTVTALDKDLIHKDARERSVPVTEKELIALLELRGGKWELLLDRLKGLLS